MKKIILESIYEDCPRGDITTQAIFGSAKQSATAQFLAKEALVVSGWDAVQALVRQKFKRLKLKIIKRDGERVKSKTVIGTASGPVQELLQFERVALNFMQHLSGIATLTSTFVKKTKNDKVKILDTRKTTPGLRSLEKLAIKHGGGHNHRFSLSDQYLIKDNHIDAAGGIKPALAKVFAHQKKQKSRAKIQIEVRTLDELTQALLYDVNMVLLDNMSLKTIRQAVILRNALAPHVVLEVSGGVTLATVARYAKMGVERISVGALTHSAKAVDISFKIR